MCVCVCVCVCVCLPPLLTQVLEVVEQVGVEVLVAIWEEEEEEEEEGVGGDYSLTCPRTSSIFWSSRRGSRLRGDLHLAVPSTAR